MKTKFFIGVVLSALPVAVYAYTLLAKKTPSSDEYPMFPTSTTSVPGNPSNDVGTPRTLEI